MTFFCSVQFWTFVFYTPMAFCFVGLYHFVHPLCLWCRSISVCPKTWPGLISGILEGISWLLGTNIYHIKTMFWVELLGAKLYSQAHTEKLSIFRVCTVSVISLKVYKTILRPCLKGESHAIREKCYTNYICILCRQVQVITLSCMTWFWKVGCGILLILIALAPTIYTFIEIWIGLKKLLRLHFNVLFLLFLFIPILFGKTKT